MHIYLIIITNQLFCPFSTRIVLLLKYGQFCPCIIYMLLLLCDDCLYMIRVRDSLLYNFWFLRYLNVLPEPVYCCFTRTTLFTTTLTFIIVVCSNTSTCIPSFILIGCCVSEIKVHLYLYHNVWPEAINVVLQELHCLLKCLHTCIIKVRGCYHVTKFCCTTLSSF